jgi:hypothetical protein
MTRYALLTGSSKEVTGSADRLSGHKLSGLIKRWQSSLSMMTDEPFIGFGSAKPTILYPLKENEFIECIKSVQAKPEDELFFYYTGHSYPTRSGSVAFAFEDASIAELEHLDINQIFSRLFLRGFGKIFFVLDTCHAGSAIGRLRDHQDKCFGMFASVGYAHVDQGLGIFSTTLLEGMDVRLKSRYDKRIDRLKRGMTFLNWFEYAQYSMIPSVHVQRPVSFGDCGEDIFLKVPSKTPSEFNAESPWNSVYRKLFVLLEIIGTVKSTASAIDFISLMEEVKQRKEFLVENGEGGATYVSSPRIYEMVSFLRSLGFVNESNKLFALSSLGHGAANLAMFNSRLIEAIVKNIFPRNTSLEDLRKTCADLLKEGYMPNAYNVGTEWERAGNKINDKRVFKEAFSILGYTLEFQKPSYDTIFPN